MIMMREAVLAGEERERSMDKIILEKPIWAKLLVRHRFVASPSLVLLLFVRKPSL
jgi:hypothetical protein